MNCVLAMPLCMENQLLDKKYNFVVFCILSCAQLEKTRQPLEIHTLDKDTETWIEIDSTHKYRHLK